MAIHVPFGSDVPQSSTQFSSSRRWLDILGFWDGNIVPVALLLALKFGCTEMMPHVGALRFLPAFRPKKILRKMMNNGEHFLEQTGELS